MSEPTPIPLIPPGIRLVETPDGFEISAPFRHWLFTTHAVLMASFGMAVGLGLDGWAISLVLRGPKGWGGTIFLCAVALLMTYIGLRLFIGALLQLFGTFVFRVSGDEASFTTRLPWGSQNKRTRTFRWSDVKEFSVVAADGSPPTPEFAFLLMDGRRIVFLDSVRGKKLEFLTAFFKKKVAEVCGKRGDTMPVAIDDGAPEWILWTPLRHCNSVRGLSEEKDGSLRVIPPKGWWLFLCVLPLISYAAFSVPFLLTAPISTGAVVGVVVAAVLGSVFLFAWVAILRSTIQPVRIDPTAQIFRNLPSSQLLGFAKRNIPFADIRGIQVLETLVTLPESGTALEYQTNLLLRDGTRLNVMCHCNNAPQAQSDARTLACIIRVPLWERMKHQGSVA